MLLEYDRFIINAKIEQSFWFELQLKREIRIVKYNEECVYFMKRG